MVSSLIDENSKWWNRTWLKLSFYNLKLMKCSNSLSVIAFLRTLIWLANRKGSFSVKSAYYVAKELLEPEAAGASSSNHLASPFWKKIWQVNVPPKIKIFASCMCLNGLPTMLNLRQRGLNTAGFCQICDKELESTSHAFVPL